MIKGEMEREIAGCLVRALADGCQRPAILDLVQEIVPAVNRHPPQSPSFRAGSRREVVACGLISYVLTYNT